jgi:8-oxo-dGTP diphosphatase
MEEGALLADLKLTHHDVDRMIPVVGVGVMVVRDGKVLLGKRQGSHGAGQYGWCGGGLEFGESFEDAARREVYEESGLAVTRLKILCISNIRHYGRHYVDVEFIARAVGEPLNREPGKTESWSWYDFGSLPSPLFRPVELALESYHTRNFYNP